MWRWLKRLCDFSSIQLAIVRRYADANGHYVGELYAMQGKAYVMIGASLDSLPLEYTGGRMWRLDTKRDFLAPMPRNVVRVGAVEPENNEYVRRIVARMPRMNMSLLVQNRFIERVMEHNNGR